MTRHWKTPYSRTEALAAGIHDFEEALVTGPPDARWIYRVEVLDFEFVFFSLDMIRDYIDYYSRDLLPARRAGRSPFSQRPAASVGDGQSRFERLPARLRAKGKREQVVRALSRALDQFSAEESAA